MPGGKTRNQTEQPPNPPHPLPRAAIILLALIAAISSSYATAEMPTQNYIYTEDGRTWDATQYVVSGEYFFDCNKQILVRRKPIEFTTDMIHNSKGIYFREVIFPELSGPFEAYKNSRDWADGFTYRCSYLLEGSPVKITGHSFEKIIQVNQEKYIIRLSYHPAYPTPIRIVPYDPEKYVPYEEMKIRAQNSCEHPQ